MKTHLKFLLALGSAKLVMLDDKRGASFYAADADARRASRTDLGRIADALARKD